MKHQSLIEHLNLPPGYDTEVIEKAIDLYFEKAKLWYKAEGWDNGYEFAESVRKKENIIFVVIITAVNIAISYLLFKVL